MCTERVESELVELRLAVEVLSLGSGGIRLIHERVAATMVEHDA